MTCYKPLKGYLARARNLNGRRNVVFNPNQGYQDRPVQLPCGQCIGCRLERSRQWAIRCYHEAKLYDNNAFVTLTYDDEHLPEGGTLVLRDFQLFMKRLRKHYGAGIRFYACGEYGDLKGRPHYHACLFNIEILDLKIHKIRKELKFYTSETIDTLWGMGFTLTGDVTFQSAAYVARYIMKKIHGEAATKHYETVDLSTGEIFQQKPEFTTMSRRPGIGNAWYQQFKTDVYPDDFVIMEGKKLSAPRYYDKLYEITDPGDYNRMKGQRVQNAKKHADDQTKDRLTVREKVHLAKAVRLPRTLE